MNESLTVALVVIIAVPLAFVVGLAVPMIAKFVIWLMRLTRA